MTDIVLIQGWGRDGRHWSTFPQELAQKFPDARVTRLDAPGTGTEAHRLAPLAVNETAEDFHYRWKKTGRGPALLVGISFGGMIALEWANAFPQDARAVSVINTSIANYSKLWHRLRWGQLPHLIKLVRQNDACQRERGILEIISNLPEDHRHPIAAQWEEYARHVPVSKRNIYAQLLAAMRFRLERIPQVPVQVIASRHDRMVNPKCSAALAQKTQGPIVWHPQAGHHLVVDDPRWTAETIAEFARGPAPARRL